MFVLGIKLETEGNLDESCDMVLMNHQSLLDIIVMEYIHSRDLAWVAKKEITDLFFFGHIIKAPRMISIDRENKAGIINLLKEAKSDFDSKKYEASTPKYEKLLEANYKPAEVNYYLAENWYMRKKYDAAISYYKKSAMLNDKAAYMPTLLLHSAISFEKTKDKDNAKSFYSTLIDLYPDSNEAKTAKQNLSKL